MSRCAMVWILAVGLVLPLMSTAPAMADPINPTRIAVSNEGGVSDPVILWSLVARLAGPNGSGLDPSGKPSGGARGPEIPVKTAPGTWLVLMDDGGIRSF